ncbi:apoptosis-stimulating of p53 protein 1-like [Lytechinus pictus]|uniref:apoptosis-stimulating of p53 protein 1-like n=1 Tax=Lytechinus pictus TaxID=7653 RepID=UPI0030BA210D
MDHNGLPGQMILKVYLSNSPDTLSDVPITPETRCRDVVELCREAGEVHCHLAELWRGCERPIDDEEKIYDILQQWGIHRNEVKFFLRHEGANADEQGMNIIFQVLLFFVSQIKITMYVAFENGIG